jgi:hypothetical protein
MNDTGMRPGHCERCRAPIQERWFSLRIGTDPSASDPRAIHICPKCLESLEHWINQHLRKSDHHRQGGQALDDPLNLSSRGSRPGTKGHRVNRRAELERQLDREVSFINNAAFWAMGAILVAIALVAVFVLSSKIRSLLPNDQGAAQPTMGALEGAPVGPVRLREPSPATGRSRAMDLA